MFFSKHRISKTYEMLLTNKRGGEEFRQTA